ncbi:DNA cytosine methyltransferase [Pectobacterium polaris]|uniref:DNA cytosine methyltransferase n=1 Tax=Pectobacterium polaris TaxID=2042057 RepID=UPI0032E45AD9
MSVWPTEVQQAASSVIPVHQLSQERREALLTEMHGMFLRRENPADIQKAAHKWARRQAIEIARPDVENGLVVVGFAGGGGSCEGIKQALGFEPHIAMNHNPVAMAMHAMNHPCTLHYPEDIFSVDPVVSTGGLPVLLGWFSPDCRHFSKAKGGTPVKKEIRGLAWVVLRWALATRPRVLMMENVEEFRSWGPLIEKAGSYYPDPAKKGETFKAFIGMLSTGIPANHPALAECCEFLNIDINGPDAKKLVNGLGYNVDHRERKAYMSGAPTIRKRLYVVARCDGRPVEWPAAEYGDPRSKEFAEGNLKPWRTAADCIDWSLPTRSILGRKKPLADNTLKRIVRGLDRFVINNPEPYIVRIGQTGFGGDRLSYPTDQPITTVTSKAEHLLVEPFAVKCNHTSNRSAYDCFRGQSLREPLQTITQAHGFSIAAPVVVRQFGNSTANPADTPLGTVTAGGGGKSQLLSAILVGAGGPKYSGKPRDINAPYDTVPTSSHKAVIAANLIKHYGGGYSGPGCSMDEPLHTVTQVDHHSVCSSHLIKLRGTCQDGQQSTEPAPTITAGGQHVGHVQAYLTKYYGNERDGVSITEPMHTIPTRDRFGLAEVECEIQPLTDEQRYNAWCCARLVEAYSDLPDDTHLFPAPRRQYLRVGDYVIIDICMRMLSPRELYNAQGFPPDYIIDRDPDGNPISQKDQVARCGNAVCPTEARALVAANLPEYCVWQVAA